MSHTEIDVLTNGEQSRMCIPKTIGGIPMSQTKIDLRDLVAEVRKAAAANPDKSFSGDLGTGCRYFNFTDGTPVCIVGHALAALGATDAMVVGDNDTGIRFLAARGGRDLTFVQSAGDEYLYIEWLAAVQGAQDCGSTWSYAVERADTAWPLPITA